MREQLIHYVSLLFAGAKNAEDIQQEIMQNTLDRYDDMIAQGKTPEAAYRLAISGIGDINEILNTIPCQDSSDYAAPIPASEENSPASKIIRAIAIGLYILSPIPLFVLSELNLSTLGLCCISAGIFFETGQQNCWWKSAEMYPLFYAVMWKVFASALRELSTRQLKSIVAILYASAYRFVLRNGKRAKYALWYHWKNPKKTFLFRFHKVL